MEAYITSIGLISPQPTFQNDFSCNVVYENQPVLKCMEPAYKDYINPVQLRRMSRILKLGLGASQICLNNAGNITPDAIIVGTGLACVNDLEIFLKSIFEENEQSLSPIPFINSSHNTVAAQIARMLKVQSYNNTHCHRGASFENALLDALMLINEQEAEQVLLGGIDEFSHNYYTLLEHEGMWHANADGKAAAAGEGAGFFIVGKQKTASSFARITAVKTFYNPAQNFVDDFLKENNLNTKNISAIMPGINGNTAHDAIYDQQLKDCIPPAMPLITYKHLCGEYTTSSAFALAIAAHALREGKFPQACLSHGEQPEQLERILLYNHYRNQNHSLIAIEKI